MSVHIFPGWLDGVRPESGHDLVLAQIANQPGIPRRPTTIRADLPAPSAEGQTERRWHAA